MKLKALLFLAAFTASASVTTAADNATRQAVDAGVSKGLGRFLSTYSETGMAGVQDAVTACYEDQKFGPTLDGIAACASMDKRAKDEDAVWMKAALKRLKPNEQDRKVLVDAINDV